MKKQLLTITLTLLATVATFAQEVWYDVNNAVTDLTFTSTCDGCSASTVTNPDATDTENTNVLLWKIPAAPTLDTAGLTEEEIAALSIGNKEVLFSFPDGYGLTPTDFDNTTANTANTANMVVTVRLYLPDLTNYSNFDSNTRFRLYLGAQTVQLRLKDLEELSVDGWYTLTYDFSGKTYTENVTGGSIRIIGQTARFTNLNNDIDFHFDTFTSTVALSELEEEVEEVDPIDPVAVLDAGNEWYHNYNTDTFTLTVNEVQGGVFLEQTNAVATPTTTGNSSPLVAKFTKEEEASSQVKFQLPGVITAANQASAIFKIRAYIPSTNTAPAIGSRLRLFLRDENLNTNQKNVTVNVSVFDAWQEYTFDFTGTNLTEGISYSTVNLLFDQPDVDPFPATGNVYYLDAFQGPSSATLPVDHIEFDDVSSGVYPNPVANSFKIDSSINVENVELYTISGSLLKTFTAQASYDISNLANGVYIVNIKTSTGTDILKIVKE